MSIDFDIIKSCVQDLKTDFTNGSRVLATKALGALHDAVQPREGARGAQEELWRDLRIAAYELSNARPSMSAAITSALVQALDAIRNSDGDAKSVLAQEITKRAKIGAQIAQHFLSFMERCAEKKRQAFGKSISLNILTLSLSSTLRDCLFRAIQDIRNIYFNVRILESRPNCEGADFAVLLLQKFPAEASDGRLFVEVAPEAYVCAFARDVDILLLGADRIAAGRDVSNKVGSLPSALCVKALSPTAEVVIVSDSDKIASSGPGIENSEECGPSKEVMSAWKDETRAAAEDLERKSVLQIHNAYFEWVPARFIDWYLTEQGAMDSGRIAIKSQETGRLKEELFDGQIRSLAQG